MGAICCACNKPDVSPLLPTAEWPGSKPATIILPEGAPVATDTSSEKPLPGTIETDEVAESPINPAYPTPPPTAPTSPHPALIEPPPVNPVPTPEVTICLLTSHHAERPQSHYQLQDEEEEEDILFDDDDHQDNVYDDRDDDDVAIFNEDFKTPVYTIALTAQRVCIFEPFTDQFHVVDRAKLSLRRLHLGWIYSVTPFVDELQLVTLSTEQRQLYVGRDSVVYDSPEAYWQLVLPGLLLGCRVRDYEQRCASVIQTDALVLSMPAQNRRLTTLQLRTSESDIFEVDVTAVQLHPKRWRVVCASRYRLPSSVRPGALLELLNAPAQQPRVTAALLRAADAADSAASNSWPLLNCIYGASGARHHASVPDAFALLRLANGEEVRLNFEQTEALARYNDDSCPGFVVEAPPGSGKTLTAAALALGYEGTGVQLFLSTANVPVANMALALAKLDYGGLRAIHLCSSEREQEMNEESRSPFSLISLALATRRLERAVVRLTDEESYTTGAQKRRLRGKIRDACAPVLYMEYDLIFGTVDMILGYLLKPARGRQRRKGVTIKQQLARVRRIVVDEASQLTESALNAIILSFPRAQIVLIGDSKQLPPFKYVSGEVISELAARSALDVVKAKKNLPVIRLRKVYRAAPSLIAHYSDIFYSGALVSCKPESLINPLNCFGDSRCIFWSVRGVAKQSGTSKINDEEIACLVHIVSSIRLLGYDERSVMVISYYEAQRRLAEGVLPEGYELLTVDSAQGREKDIVVVLTTRTSVPTEQGAFFCCPLRCNVAVSRHKEALIVIGHPSIAAAPTWADVLSNKYFNHVEWSYS